MSSRLPARPDGEEAVLETDDGERLTGRGVANEVVEDWNLDLQEHRDRWDIEGRGRRSTKLVHKLVLSMPAGTPPQKVWAAVKNFAREEFGAKHRYVMALHTDESHPHVHMVVKAVSERGERLHIRRRLCASGERTSRDNCGRSGSLRMRRNGRCVARVAHPSSTGSTEPTSEGNPAGCGLGRRPLAGTSSEEVPVPSQGRTPWSRPAKR
jgi:hypothetical protein